MKSQGGAPQLDGALRERVLERLGFCAPPSADLAGLQAVYSAWCGKVPFDNVRKMIALRTQHDLPLPGGDAEQFFETWLAHGAGGTCWPSSNALYALVQSLGFEGCRIAGCMRDLGTINHASVKVALKDCDWLVDSSLLSNVPLPLERRLFVHDDLVFPAEVEFEDSSHVVWSHTPPNSTYLPCRLIEHSYDSGSYLALYEESRARSPFNQRLYARRNLPGEMLVLSGNTRFSKTSEGVESRTLSPDEVCEALRNDIGLSIEVIEEWTRSGSLTDSLQPPAGPKPPPVTRKPPSLR